MTNTANDLFDTEPDGADEQASTQTTIGATESHEKGKVVSFPGVPQSAGSEDILSSLEAEEEYAAAVIADPDCIIVTRDAVGWKELKHKKPRAVVRAAWACMEADPPMAVSHSTLQDRLQALDLWGSGKEQVGKHYLRTLDDRAVESVVRAALDNARIIRMFYLARQVRDVSIRLVEKVESEPHETEHYATKATKHVMDVLAQTGTNRREASVAAILQTQDDTGSPFVPTGLAWLDSLIGGHRPGHMYAILGRYKGRKTTFARSLVLRALWEGMPVSWYTMDGTRLEVVNGFVAMMATYKMWQAGVPESQWILGAKGLAKAYRTKEQHEAIVWAQQELAQRPLRVYDAADGIQDVDKLETKLKRDIVLHDTQLWVADYVQKFRINTGKKHVGGFEQYEAAVDRFQALTTREQTTSVILSQRNESANKNGSDDTAGAKYGGALPAAADYVMETSYDSDDAPTELPVRLTFSRYSGTGEIVYRIDPSSGLILNLSALQ